MRGASALLAALVALAHAAAPVAAITYYVRPDGGSPAQCTGLADAPYPGAGGGQPCAWDHPFQALPPGGASRLAAGDTLIVGSGSYRMGIGAPGSEACDADSPWDCILLPPPSGASAAARTRLLGAGWDGGCPDPPELWGSGRPWQVLDLAGRDHLEIACLEITDHSSCVEFHADPAVACRRDSPPYGDWASAGVFARNSGDVRLADLDVHGLASHGVLAGGLTDWTVERVRIAANGWAGWDGDVGAGSGNAGELVFRRLEVGWNGCGETWPGGEPHGCWAQQSGGYGDGFAAGSSAGHWVLEDLHVHHNTSDGVDLLYLSAGSDLEIRRLRAEGNAGNQLKFSGPATVENSLLVGDCGYFDDPRWPWMVGGDHCRAFGNTIDVDLRPGTAVTMVNLTVAGEGDCLLGAGCPGGGCAGGELLWVRNTLFAGSTDFLQPFENTCLFYTDLPEDPGDLDWNLVWNVKNDPCPGSHSVCGQPPLLADPSLDAFDGRLQPASPAIGAADPAVAPATDLLGHRRDSDPDIGAYEAALFADGFESGDTSAWSVTVSGGQADRAGGLRRPFPLGDLLLGTRPSSRRAAPAATSSRAAQHGGTREARAADLERVAGRDSAGLSDERVASGQRRKSREVPVRAQQLTDPSVQAEGGDPGVVDLGAARAGRAQQLQELRVVRGRFGEKHQAWRLEPRLDLVDRLQRLRWGSIDPGVGHDGVELVETRPGNRPGRRSLRQGSDLATGRLVPLRIAAMSVDQEVRIHADHVPWTS